MASNTEKSGLTIDMQHFEHVRQSCASLAGELLTRVAFLLDGTKPSVNYRAFAKQKQFPNYNGDGQTLKVTAEWPVEREQDIHRGLTGRDLSGRPQSSTLGTFRAIPGSEIREVKVEVVGDNTPSGVPTALEHIHIATAAPASDEQLSLLSDALSRLDTIE